MYPTTLFVADVHVAHGQDLSRLAALGQALVSLRPDRLILGGDFLELEALSAWDFDKRQKMEGRRYRKDIAAGNQALDLITAPLLALQERQRTNKHKLYVPDLVFLEGNHESRAPRYVERSPHLEGTIDVRADLQIDQRGFTWVDYGNYYVTPEGVQYTHAPLNAAGQPPGGKYGIERVLELVAISTVFGHFHRWCSVDAQKHGSGGSTVKVLSAGCFFEHTPEYVKFASSRYYRGAVLLTHTGPGDFDVAQYSIDRLKKEFIGS